VTRTGLTSTLIGAGLLVAVACGDDSDNDGEESATTTEPPTTTLDVHQGAASALCDGLTDLPGEVADEAGIDVQPEINDMARVMLLSQLHQSVDDSREIMEAATEECPEHAALINDFLDDPVGAMERAGEL
jgi:hypothetical protein